MASKKIITSLLLVAVVGIWGYVGYSFFGGGGTGEMKNSNNTDFTFNESRTPYFANKQLQLNYEDPFLPKKVVKPVVAQNKKTEIKPKQPEKTELTYNWPSISYKGLILNQSNNQKKLAIVVVNGKESIIREGEMIAEVRVVSFDKQKVEMKHEKETRTFSK